MANTLSNFLIGVGFDYDNKGATEIGSGLDSIKGKALQLGSVVAGAFGIKKLTSDFAASRDELGKFSQTFGLLPSDVFGFGQALQHEGGSLEGFMSQLVSLEKMRAGLQQGDAGFIGMAGQAGLNVNPLIDAQNATEGYLALANQFQAMSQSQRINAAGALGLDEASIRLLSQGSEQIQKTVNRMKGIRDVTPEMTQEARRYNDQMQDLTNNIGSFADKASMTLLPAINDIVEDTNEWIDANKKLINQNLDKVLEPIGENFGVIATAGGLLAGSGILATFAGLAKHVPIVGGALGGVAAGLGKISALGAAGTIGYEILTTKFTQEGVEDTTGVKLPQWMFTPIRELWNGDDDAPSNTPKINRGFQRSDLPSVPSDFPDLPMFKNNPQSSIGGSVKSNTTLNVTLEMDGQVLSRKVMSVIDDQNELALEELTSTMVG